MTTESVAPKTSETYATKNGAPAAPIDVPRR